MKTLPFYNKYFNIAYPLPKMDLIAIADFAAGTNSILSLARFGLASSLEPNQFSLSSVSCWFLLRSNLLPLLHTFLRRLIGPFLRRAMRHLLCRVGFF